MTDRNQYPECSKMAEAAKDSAVISNFIGWLGENNYEICVWLDDSQNHPMPIRESYEQLLAKYFEIDLTKIEEERRQMLEDLQNTTNIMGEPTS